MGEEVEDLISPAMWVMPFYCILTSNLNYPTEHLRVPDPKASSLEALDLPAPALSQVPS
jgi:hypothetical protein